MGATTQEAGLKLVPNEPTEAMLRRGGQELAMTRQRPWQTVEDDARDCWQAMIGTGRYSYVSDPDIRAAPSPEPMQADLRETIARIVDPLAFSEKYVRWTDPLWADKKAKRLANAVATADAILAAMQEKSEPSAPNPDLAGLVERLEGYANAKLDLTTKQQRADLRKNLRALLASLK